MSRCTCAESDCTICPGCACAESGFTYVSLAHAQSLALDMSRLRMLRDWFNICPACACAESGFTYVPLAHAQKVWFLYVPLAHAQSLYVQLAHAQSLVLDIFRLCMCRVWFYIFPALEFWFYLQVFSSILPRSKNGKPLIILEKWKKRKGKQQSKCLREF